MRATRAQPSPTPNPDPEARGARLAARAEALSYVNDRAADRTLAGAGGGGGCRERSGQTGRGQGQEKAAFRNKKNLRETGAGALGPLRVTYRSTKSNIPSPPPIWRRAPGAQGGAVPRQLGGGDVRPTRSLSSGHLSSGEGARRAEFPCLFPISLPRQSLPKPPSAGPCASPREPHFPKTRSLSAGASRQPHAAAAPAPQATILPTCSRRNSGSERGAPPTWAHQSKTTDQGARPSRKKNKKRERAQGGGRESGASASPLPSTRAPACPWLADMAPDAQEFPGLRDISQVLRPEWGRRVSPQGEGEFRPGPGRAGRGPPNFARGEPATAARAYLPSALGHG